MRVLFCVPRSYNPKQMYREYPLGVGFLGTVLQQYGHQVRIFDQNVEGLEDELLFEELKEFRPGLLGFSVITPNYTVARRQIQKVKRVYPELLIIAGGVHATLFPEDLLADGVDVVVLGEAEGIISRLVASLEAGDDLAGLPGLVYRNPAGGVVRTSGPRPPAPLDELPFVDRRLYNLWRYPHHSMLASRGCPYHCSFCCNYTGTVRSDSVGIRPYQRVIEEIEHLRDTYGAREIFFADDIFLLRKADILDFCRAYEARHAGVRWIGQMRADRIDDRVAAAMRKAECQRVCFGVESGSDQILASAHKGMTREQIRCGILAAKASGMRVKTGWIYGLPGTLAEQYESIPFMLELRPHEISIHQLIPFPGTVYYTNPGQYGIRLSNPKRFEGFCYGGLDREIQFDYLTQAQLVRLLEDTANTLEAEGYVSSDQAGPHSEYIYTTPLSRNSMKVFRPTVMAVDP